MVKLSNLFSKILRPYFWVEEKYFDALGFLDDRGIPFKKLADGLEKRGIPSLPVFCAVLLAAIAAILFLTTPPAYASLEVSLYDALSDAPANGFVSLQAGGETIAASASLDGKAFFEKIPARELTVSVKAENFQEFAKQVDTRRTRFFTARLTPSPSSAPSELLLQEIVFPPEENALAQQQPTPSPTLPPEASPLPSQSPSPTPTPSFQPYPTPQPAREESQWLEVGQQFSFETIVFELKDVSSNQALASISREGGPASNEFLEKNKPAAFEEVQVVFLEAKQENGVVKALFSFKVFPSVERSVSTKITSPANDSVLQTALVEIEGSASSSSGESIAFVEVSVDGGKTWQRAEGREKWVFKWIAPPSGSFSLESRATTVYGLVENPVEETSVLVSPCKQLLHYGDTGGKIDLVFIASNYSRLTEFKEAVDASLNALFSRRPFVESYAARRKINVYYYSYGVDCKLAGDKPPLDRMWACEIPKQFFEACSFADLTAVLVNSSVRAGVSGNPFVQSAGNPDIFAHEAGHALFDLADRYCCDGGYWQAGDYPNLWAQEKQCNDYVKGFNASCRGIGAGSWSEQSDDSLMRDLQYGFDDSDVDRINFVLSKYV